LIKNKEGKGETASKLSSREKLFRFSLVLASNIH